MAYVEVKCINCGSEKVIKFGKRPNGHQRYRCKSCQKTFQLDYTYKACEPGMKDKIVDMAMNAAGTRDRARTLKISRGTVTSVLRKLKASVQEVNTAYLEKKLPKTTNGYRNT